MATLKAIWQFVCDHRLAFIVLLGAIITFLQQVGVALPPVLLTILAAFGLYTAHASVVKLQAAHKALLARFVKPVDPTYKNN